MRHRVHATPAAMLLTLVGIAGLLWYWNHYGADQLATMFAALVGSVAALLTQKLRFGDATGARFDGITIAIAWTTLFLALVFTPFP